MDIFTNMGRLSQLIQYYRTVQKRLLQQHWTETNELSRNTNTTQFLREFYDHLFETYQKQVKWCNTVFGVQGAQEPVWVIIELLPSLQPSRETVINSLLKNNDDKLSILEGVSNANIHFGRLLAANFKDADVSVDVLKKISGAIYDYFTTFIGQTATFEQQWLMTRLNELILIHSNAIESVRALGNANNKIFQWSNDTLRRCQAITQNCGLAAIVVVLSVSGRDSMLFIVLSCETYLSFLFRTFSKPFWKSIEKLNSNCMPAKALNKIGTFCRHVFHFYNILVIFA